MPRVLIVTSCYRPGMLADMQRARVLAWELPQLGWDVEILAPSESEIRQDAISHDDSIFFAPSVTLHSVSARYRNLFAYIGMRSPTYRLLPWMYLKGRQVLKSRQFDLVYISTTSFTFFSLGRLWKELLGIPYVLDYHDPWLKTSKRYHRKGFKSRIGDLLSSALEAFSTRKAAGIVAVSQPYIRQLSERYARSRAPWLDSGRTRVLPFGVRSEDLDLVQVKESGDSPQTSLVLRYVGAGGPIMARSFETICRQISHYRSNFPNHPFPFRVELYGTTYNWKEGDPCFLWEIAKRYGVGDLVSEFPQRVSYKQSIELLKTADGLIVLGVDDQDYIPSKLFYYAVSGKPLLAAFRKDSPAYLCIEHSPNLGHLLWFADDSEMSPALSQSVFEGFTRQLIRRETIDRGEALRNHLSTAMTRQHAILFNSCMNPTAG